MEWNPDKKENELIIPNVAYVINHKSNSTLTVNFSPNIIPIIRVSEIARAGLYRTYVRRNLYVVVNFVFAVLKFASNLEQS